MPFSGIQLAKVSKVSAKRLTRTSEIMSIYLVKFDRLLAVDGQLTVKHVWPKSYYCIVKLNLTNVDTMQRKKCVNEKSN